VIIDPEPGKHYPVCWQIRMSKDETEFGLDRNRYSIFITYCEESNR